MSRNLPASLLIVPYHQTFVSKVKKLELLRGATEVEILATTIAKLVSYLADYSISCCYCFPKIFSFGIAYRASSLRVEGKKGSHLDFSPDIQSLYPPPPLLLFCPLQHRNRKV